MMSRLPATLESMSAAGYPSKLVHTLHDDYAIDQGMQKSARPPLRHGAFDVCIF